MNMKKNGIICRIILCGIISVFVFSSGDVNADPYVDGNISVGGCLAEGNIDFGLFLNTFIYNDGFYDGVIEPWKDILERNQCHSTDISSLIKQQDKIRKYIRDAFLTCNNEKIPSLKVAFEKLNIEIYYARNVVDGKIIATLPFDLLSTRTAELEEGELESGDYSSLYYPSDKLYADIIEKYAGKTTLSTKELDLFFSKLEFKYQDRKKEYVICTNDSWAIVAEKWEEFINSAGGIAPAWKKAEKSIGGASEKLVESATDTGLGVWYASELAILELDVEEFTDQFLEYVPDIDFDSTLTQGAMLDAVGTANFEYNVQKLRQEMSSYYESLYLDTSNAGLEAVLLSLEEYNKILSDSFKPLDEVLTGTKMMNNRQCPGKF
jgi:sugar-specific transcriptional regulator TrmB